MTDEEKTKAEAFLVAYRSLSDLHGFDFAATLQADQNGIVPRLTIVKKKSL